MTDRKDKWTGIKFAEKPCTRNSTKIKDIRGDIRIKVEQDCRDYIKNNGKTEAVVVQGKNYNVITDDGTREFLGQKYFVFHLESTS